MLLLISDANVIIDLEAGELIEKLFELPYRFAVPDVLYEEEIEPDSPHLAGWGLEVLVISGDYIDYAVELGHRYGDEPGLNDRLALALAKQESCPLLGNGDSPPTPGDSPSPAIPSWKASARRCRGISCTFAGGG